ncbi:MAG: putative metal-dependent hydrolase [Bacteroidota bacterium]|nr:putative metal-dependent hydrolase [Bacteroidota bacterium]
METNLEALQYPVGKHTWPQNVTDQEVQHAIKSIAAFPDKIQHATERLDKEQLDTPYRPGGWTVRQVVHHVADSHLNAYMRFKLALTEEDPVIKPYDQTRWAQLSDSTLLPPAISYPIIRGIHTRWGIIMENIQPEVWDRVFIHPEHNWRISLRQAAMLYEWHGNHHLAHVTKLAEKMGW